MAFTEKLFRYFATNNEYSVEKLLTCIKSKEKETDLVRIFGFLSTQQVKFSELDSNLKKLYQNCLKKLQNDFSGCLEDTDYSNDREFKLITTGQNFSWNIRNYLSFSSNETHAKETMVLWLEAHPFPFEAAKVLILNRTKTFNPLINYIQERIDSAVRFLFDSSQPQISALDFFTHERSLVKSAALVLKNGRTISWIEALKKWNGLEEGPREKIFKTLKLSHLIDINSTKTNKIAFGMHSSSFQTYLIHKTLILLKKYDIPLEIYSQFENLFKKSEEDRRLICFLISILEELFAKEEKFSLSHLFKLTLYEQEKKQDTAFSLGLTLLSRLKTKELTHQLGQVLLAAMWLDKSSEIKIFSIDRNCILFWVFECKDLPLIEETLRLCSTLLHLLPKRLYSSLLQTMLRTHSQELPQTMECLWKIVDKFTQGNFKLETFKGVALAIERQLYLCQDILHAQYYLFLDKQRLNLLYSYLEKATQLERQQYRKELRLYWKYLPKIYDEKEVFLIRKSYFDSAIKNYAETLFCRDAEEIQFSEVCIPFLEAIEKVVQEPIPLVVVINIFLYPIFHPNIIDQLKELENLQQKFYQLHSNSLPPVELLTSKKYILERLFDSYHRMPDLVIDGNHALSIDAKLEDLKNILDFSVCKDLQILNSLSSSFKSIRPLTPTLLVNWNRKGSSLTVTFISMQRDLEAFSKTFNIQKKHELTGLFKRLYEAISTPNGKATFRMSEELKPFASEVISQSRLMIHQLLRLKTLNDEEDIEMINEEDLLSLAREGYVYTTPNTFSLIPLNVLSLDKNKSFQLKKNAFCEKFKNLMSFIQSEKSFQTTLEIPSGPLQMSYYPKENHRVTFGNAGYKNSIEYEGLKDDRLFNLWRWQILQIMKMKLPPSPAQPEKGKERIL